MKLKNLLPETVTSDDGLLGGMEAEIDAFQKKFAKEWTAKVKDLFRRQKIIVYGGHFGSRDRNPVISINKAEVTWRLYPQLELRGQDLYGKMHTVEIVLSRTDGIKIEVIK